MLRIDLLRHGHVEGGVKYRGMVDDPLTEEGRIVMNQVWQSLESTPSVIISSPLSRCLEPAREWALQAGIPCVVEPGIIELHYGAWEGKTAEEIELISPGLLRQWRTNPEHLQPPQGESMHDFAQRIQVFWQEMLGLYQGEHLLLVGHSGSIRMLIAHALQAPIVSTRHLAMPYACWSRIEIEQGEASLVFHARQAL